MNLHLGEAETIFGPDGNLVESRPTPPTGLGVQRRVDLADLLKDCRAVLVSGAGETPRQVLAEAGVQVQLTEGLVADALDALSQGRAFAAPPRIPLRRGLRRPGQRLRPTRSPELRRLSHEGFDRRRGASCHEETGQGHPGVL